MARVHPLHSLALGASTVAVVILGSLSIASVAGATSSRMTTIGSCTIVSSPTPKNHTNCPGANLSGADLAGLNLAYANLDRANLADTTMATCILVPPPNFAIQCSTTNLSDSSLTHAAIDGAILSSCVTFPQTPTLTAVDCAGATFSGANLGDANLSDDDLSSVTLTDARLHGVDFTGTVFVTCYTIAAGGYQECPGANLTDAVIDHADLSAFDLATVDFDGANLTGSSLSDATLGLVEPIGNSDTNFENANLSHVNLSGTDTSMADLSGATLENTLLTGTPLVPANQSATATSRRGARVSWAAPPGQAGATPGPCSRRSGSEFRNGTTTVRCDVIDSQGNNGKGLFTVTVSS